MLKRDPALENLVANFCNGIQATPTEELSENITCESSETETVNPTSWILDTHYAFLERRSMMMMMMMMMMMVQEGIMLPPPPA